MPATRRFPPQGGNSRLAVYRALGRLTDPAATWVADRTDGGDCHYKLRQSSAGPRRWPGGSYPLNELLVPPAL